MAADVAHRREGLAPLAKIAAVLVLYVVVARLGLMLGAVSRFATLVWAPTGLSLAAVLIFGNRIASGIFLGAFVANAWAGAPWPVALLIATGNTLEALLGAYVMRRAGFRGALEGLRHVLALIVPAAMLSTLLSATLGVLSLRLGHLVSADRVWVTWRAWWIGDMLGDLVVAPFLLTWANRSHWSLRKVGSARLVEAMVLAVLLQTASTAMFFTPPDAVAYPLEFPYVLFPIFIWAAARFGLPGATLAVFATSVMAIRGTVLGLGPFSRGDLADGLLALQTFMGCGAMAPLVVAGAISDRARLELEAAREAARREARLHVLSQASRDFADAKAEEPSLLELIARHAARAIGDVCLIRLLTEDGEHLRLAALHHEDPKLLAELRRLFEAGPSERLGDLPSSTVVETGSPILLGSRKAFRDSVSPRVLSFFGGVDVHAVLAVPLRNRSETIGSIALARVSPGASYTEEDQALLQELGDRAGLAIHNARLHEDLRAAVQVRDDFLAIAGHELKTPLAAMLMQLQSLERAAPKESPKLGERLTKASKSGQRLDRLVNQLLDVSRITAGRLRLETERLDLVEIVREVVARFTEADPANVVISLESDQSIQGEWDRLRIDQVVNNLVANALKYGQGKPVLVTLRLVNEQAVLRVIDRGIGIHPEHKERIFQRFERAVATRDFGGLGLGLWITGQIVQASGGTIGVESTVGEGSVFTVRIPLTPNLADSGS